METVLQAANIKLLLTRNSEWLLSTNNSNNKLPNRTMASLRIFSLIRKLKNVNLYVTLLTVLNALSAWASNNKFRPKPKMVVNSIRLLLIDSITLSTTSAITTVETECKQLLNKTNLASKMVMRPQWPTSRMLKKITITKKCRQLRWLTTLLVRLRKNSRTPPGNSSKPNATLALT